MGREECHAGRPAPEIVDDDRPTLMRFHKCSGEPEFRAVTAPVEVRGRTPAAPPQAAELALHALRLTGPTDRERFPRAVAAVDALLAAKRVVEATQLARAVLARDRPPVDTAARLRIRLSSILLMTGRPHEAVEEAETILDLPGIPGDLRDTAEVVRLHSLLALDDAPRAQVAAEAILAGDPRWGGDGALAAALSALAWISWDRGVITVALGLIRAAVQRVGHEQLPALHPRLSLVTMLTAVGELDEAESILQRESVEIKRTADTLYDAAPPLFRARIHLAAGRLDRADADAQAALTIAEELKIETLLPFALATLGQVAVLRGDLYRAARYAERYLREPTPPHHRLGPATHEWTVAHLTDASGAMRTLNDLYESLPARPILLLDEPHAAAWLTRVALAAGDQRRAETVVYAAEQLATNNTEHPAIAAAAAHARGLLSHDVTALERAAAGYRHPWASASASEDIGKVLVLAGERGAARGALRPALAIYERVGAEGDAARVRTKLQDLLVRPGRRRPSSGWPSLTGTQQRVARFVAEGLTNAQAADRLFLSPHTVDFHLRQIFQKLGIHSRVELTRQVLERGV